LFFATVIVTFSGHLFPYDWSMPMPGTRVPGYACDQPIF
jgi:hypothetical protein